MRLYQGCAAKPLVCFLIPRRVLIYGIRIRYNHSTKWWTGEIETFAPNKQYKRRNAVLLCT